jgi:hypothetical protein
MPELGAQDDLTGFVVGRDSISPADRAEVWARWCAVDSRKKVHGGDGTQFCVVSVMHG